MTSSFTRFLDYTQWHITVSRTPLDEWSARRRDLYLTTHNTHNRQTSMPPVGFEPTTSAGERPQTYALDRSATGTGVLFLYVLQKANVTLLFDKILRLRFYLYPLTNNIILNTSRPVRMTGKAAHMRENKNYYSILVRKPEDRRFFWRSKHRTENNIKKYLKEKGSDGIKLIHLAQNWDKWWVLVNMVMNLEIPHNAENFFISCENISFSR